MTKSKFEFYEVVKVCSTKLHLSKVNNLAGVIVGKSHDDESNRWGYTLDFKSITENYFIFEEDLVATGDTVDESVLKSNQSIQV